MEKRRSEKLKSSKVNNSILEGIVVVCIMAIYIVYGINFLPLLIFLIPVPFIVLGIRHGINISVFTILLTLGIVQILVSDSSLLALMLIFVPLTLVLNYSIKKRYSKIKTTLLSALSFLGPLVVLILLGQEIAGMNLIAQLENSISQIVASQLETLKEADLTNYSMVQARDLLMNAYNELLVLIPSYISLFSVFVAYVNFAISTFVLRKLGYGVMTIGSFSKLKLPNNIIPGIAIMFVTAFILKMLKIDYSEALLLNITFLVGMVFVFQGLAVLDFLLKKKNTKLLFRIIILIFMFAFIPISSIIFFIGLFDSMFDMRKIRRKKA